MRPSRPAQWPFMIQASGRKTARQSVIVLAFARPTPILLIVGMLRRSCRQDCLLVPRDLPRELSQSEPYEHSCAHGVVGKDYALKPGINIPAGAVLHPAARDAKALPTKVKQRLSLAVES